jgi:hypothetical protein
MFEPKATAPHLDSTDLKIAFEKFRSLGGRSEEISQICVVWGKAVAVSRLEPPTVLFNPITFSRRLCIPTKENSIVISVLLETRTCRNTL